MRILFILLVLLPILLSLAEGAPSPKPATKTTVKKGKQLVYYVPGQGRAEGEPPGPPQHDEPDDEEADDDDDAEDEEDDDQDDDADDDQDDDGGLNIPDFNEIFPNPDGRPVGPNSYDAFMKHKPGGISSGPAAQGIAGPRGQGQAGPLVQGQAGPGGARRHDGQYLGRVGISVDDSVEDNFYPKRDGREGLTRVVSPVRQTVGTNYRVRQPVMYTPVSYNRRNYVPYRRPTGQVFYANRPQVVGNRVYPATRVVGATTGTTRPVTRVVSQPRPVYTNSVPVRRTLVPVQVPMSYRPVRYKGNVPYVVVPQRYGGRHYNPWSYSPLRGDNYNPEYVVNPTEMLSRRRIRYHPTQAIPVQRIPMYDGGWGNPRYIQRDPWTGANYHGSYFSSQI